MRPNFSKPNHILVELSTLANTVISTHLPTDLPSRFTDVQSQGGSLSVSMRGKPGEHVTLAYALGISPQGDYSHPRGDKGLQCKTATVMIGTSGTSTIILK